MVEQLLYTLDQIVELKACSEHAAIGYAKLAIPVQNKHEFGLYAHNITWDKFKHVCILKFKPPHQQLVLNAQFEAIKWTVRICKVTFMSLSG